MDRSKEVVYEGRFAQPGHGGKQRVIRMLVNFNNGQLYVLRFDSENRKPTQVLAAGFAEPDDSDWRAGHGMAFEQAKKHLEDVIVMMGSLGYVELQDSPGWLVPMSSVFQHYLVAERSRHPLPMMH